MAEQETVSGREKEEGLSSEYDLIVIGAGPAGLFCAIACRQAGKKILILGEDGAESTIIDHYGDHGRFLRPALLGFSNADLISFFEKRGLSMTVEENGKVFPASRSSGDVLSVLLKECGAEGIELFCGQPARQVSRSEEGFLVRTDRRQYRSPLLRL